MSKPSIPQGTRDFGPATVRKRNYIFNAIREVFELYGFQPLETPAMENLETLLGKYGEEGDKLIFRILNNGLDNPAKHQQAREDFEKILAGKNAEAITERALRYDLTIPFARYIAMNHGQLTFPFKRYQMQPVWRADRPQKGRYREFYQCDADIVGTYSLLSDVELVQLYADVFDRLGMDVEIRINSRKILQDLADRISLNREPGFHDSPGGEGPAAIKNDAMIIATAIDKLEKIGMEKVKQELGAKGLNPEQIEAIEKYLSIGGDNARKLQEINVFFGDRQLPGDQKKNGIDELAFVLKHFTSRRAELVIDFTLARGLNYYTGIIFEVKAKNVSIGSVGGGGRYDDLTGLFGVPDIPGVGISFGVDRICDVMEELNLFPEDLHTGTKVLFFNLGEDEANMSLGLMQHLRSRNIPCELYLEKAKFDKQFKYADKKNIPYAIIIGGKELEEKSCTIRNLKTGEQRSVGFGDLTDFHF